MPVLSLVWPWVWAAHYLHHQHHSLAANNSAGLRQPEECQGHAGGQLGLGTSHHENRQLPGPEPCLLSSTGPVSLAVTTEDGVLWKQIIARTEVMGGPLKANCEERSKWGVF